MDLGAAMKLENPSRNNIRVRNVVLRVFVYGVPIAIGFLGFALGWWERMFRAAG